MAWLTGWNYRNTLTISNPGSTLTDYQVTVIIDTASLVTAGKMLSNCNDIRFTDSGGSNVLNHWIESGCNTASTNIWIKIPSISAGANTIYLYYGNPSATNTQSGANTFVFFDDFTGPSLDTSKWTVVGAAVIDTGELKITSNGNVDQNGIVSKSTFARPFIVEWTERNLASPDAYGFHGYGSSTLNYQSGLLIYRDNGNTNVGRRLDNTINTLVTIADGTTIKVKLIFPTTGYEIYINDISRETNGTWATNNNYLQFQNYYPSGSNEWIDNVRIRKYASPEPTVSSSSWLTGWNRRKSKTVNGSTSGAQTNYQLQLTVHKGTGTDTSTDIYLGNNVRDDFGDVRFTKTDGSSLLNYWIESYTSGSVATVWVQIDSIPTAGTTIYIYYDYPSQTTTSSGSSTFDFFDNFESYSIGNLNGQGGWSGVTYYQVSSSNPHSGTKSAYATNNDGVSASPDIYHTITASKNFTVTWYVYYSGGISVGIGALYPYEGTTQIVRAINDNSGQLYDSVGALGYTMSTGKWYKFQLTIHDDNKHDIKVFDGSTQVVNLSGRANTANMTTGVDRLYLYHDFRFNTGYADDMSVRKYTSPEPTFGASGTEELATCGQPSCNLIILEILSEQLSRQYPEYIDMELVSRLTEDF